MKRFLPNNRLTHILSATVVFFAILCLGVWLAGCATAPSPVSSRAVSAISPEPTVDPQSSTVVLDIFSGMPNPTWDISAAETEILTAMLDALPPSDKQVDPRQRLGYRSFSVDLPDRSVVVYGGFVRQTMDDHFRYFIDTDQRVERRLYATAKPHISDDLYRQLDTMITQGGWPARVELDIFADNKNPTWALSAAETVILTMMLDALPSSDTSIDTSQKTGYRGFLFTFLIE